jgi:dienelactone hydrolase
MYAAPPTRRARTAAFVCSLAAPLALAGCGGDAPPIPADCNVYAWEPDVGDMSSFPTSDFLVPSDATVTGFQAQFPESADLEQYGPLGPLFREQVVDLDGVGVQGEMWLGFSATFDPDLLPVADGAVHPTDGIGILVLPDDGPARLVPTATRTSTSFLYVRPLTPLPEATRVAYFATRNLSAAAGGCLEPLDAMRQLLRRPDDDRRAAIDALTEAGAIASWRDLVALHVVTTQSITRESIAIAEHIETLSPALTGTTCTDMGTYRRCAAMLTVEDYRADDGAVTIDVDNVTPDKSWALPVAIWLPPASVTAPYPTVVYGHGLTSSRNEANGFARGFAERGWATVAIDALVHGDHPSAGGEVLEGAAATFRFFALELSNPPTLDARRLRDHWRQSTYDKLQLTRALTTSGDLDGDGTSDVDSSRLAYFGISLGGIMSTELVAMTDAYAAVVNMEGGGALSRIVYDEDSSFAPLVNLVLRRQSLDAIAQAFVALQMVLDRGDGAAYGQYVLSNRLRPSSPVPDYVFGVTLDDTTVTNASNYALARALGLPLVATEVRASVGLPVSADALPLSGNWPGGATVGLLQYDVIDDGGAVVQATHTNMPGSEVGRESINSFLSSHFDDGTATLVDPYAQLGLAHGLPTP